jgi:hypothetical protein
MALIAVAADKGAPGVTTTALALAATWPRPVLLAECDPAGGDLVYRLGSASGGRLDSRCGLLSLAVAARRGGPATQVWEHAQKLRGGLDVLVGVTSAEQGGGLDPLWGALGQVLAAVPQADVIADCGRLGPDGPYYDFLARATITVLVVRPNLAELVRLRDRARAVAARGDPGGRMGLLVVAERRATRRVVAEVGQTVAHGDSPVSVLGVIAYEPKDAKRLRRGLAGRLGKSALLRTAREAAGQLERWLSDVGQPGPADVGWADSGWPSRAGAELGSGGWAERGQPGPVGPVGSAGGWGGSGTVGGTPDHAALNHPAAGGAGPPWTVLGNGTVPGPGHPAVAAGRWPPGLVPAQDGWPAAELVPLPAPPEPARPGPVPAGPVPAGPVPAGPVPAGPDRFGLAGYRPARPGAVRPETGLPETGLPETGLPETGLPETAPSRRGRPPGRGRHAVSRTAEPGGAQARVAGGRTVRPGRC